MPDFKLRWIVLLLIALPLPALAIDTDDRFAPDTGPTPSQVVTPRAGFSELEGEIRGEEAEAARPPEGAPLVSLRDHEARVEQLALERSESRRAQVGTGFVVSLLGAGLTLATAIGSESMPLTLVMTGVWLGGTAAAVNAVGSSRLGVRSRLGPSVGGALLGLMIGTGVGAMAGFIGVIVAFIAQSEVLFVVAGLAAGACVLLGPPVGAMLAFEGGGLPDAGPSAATPRPTVRLLSGPPSVARSSDGWVVRQNLATVRF